MLSVKWSAQSLFISDKRNIWFDLAGELRCYHKFLEHKPDNSPKTCRCILRRRCEGNKPATSQNTYLRSRIGVTLSALAPSL